MEQKSNEYSLYIPRVSISSSSSSSKGSSRLKEFAQEKRSANGEVETSGESESEGVYGSSVRNYDGGPRTTRNQMYFVHKAPKRGSHSTQSSSSSSAASNHSNYNVNSLLLSVKNLENFNRSRKLVETETIYESDHKRQMLENIRTILAIDDVSLTADKTKDTDELSTVSSMTNTNFTVVTFNDSSRNKTKSKAICRRSHQLTILILVMTFLFLVGISGLVCMLEMRYKKMPR